LTNQPIDELNDFYDFYGFYDFCDSNDFPLDLSAWSYELLSFCPLSFSMLHPSNLKRSAPLTSSPAPDT
jgi:hypothetical protein